MSSVPRNYTTSSEFLRVFKCANQLLELVNVAVLLSTPSFQMTSQVLPLFVKGVVTKGFGRGSKELGCPTANYSQEVVQGLPEGLETGIYCGWASVDGGSVFKMVMSVGWNPFYNGKEKTMEIHILHEFEKPFYGSLMRVCVLKYLRPEMNFNSVEELITQIQEDISVTKMTLDESAFCDFKNHEYFIDPAKS